MSRGRVYCFVLMLSAVGAPALAAGQPASVKAITIAPSENGAILQIVATRPLTPQLQTVENPLRLVIDLPGSNLATARKRIPFRNQQIKAVRMNQFQSDPAVARIVVDLASPVSYTWDAMGNRLNIRIHSDDSASAKPATVPAMTPGAQPVAVPYAEGSTGTLVEAGSRVGSGSSITAKDETAVLRLSRGGEVRVCPGTTLSVATSPAGSDLMLGMNTGSIETHYHLDESSDSIMTPDFRIVLPGPGEFNLAIKSDPRGDTCVSSLAGSNSSVVVAEILGNQTYEVKPEQQVLFRQGSMQSVETPVTGCGCPPPQEPVMRASDPPSLPPPVTSEEKAGSQLALSNSNTPQPAAASENGSPAGGSSAAAIVPTAPTAGDQQQSQSGAQVSTGLVFNAKELARERAAAAPAPPLTAEVGALPLSSKRADPLPPVVVLPPPEAEKKEHRGFFSRLFHAIF